MIINYAVDIFYILAALFLVIFFAYQGFFSSIFHFGRYIAAAILTYFIGPVFSRFLYNKWIFLWIADPVAEKVENFLNNTVGSVDIEGLVDSLPALVRKFADVEALSAKYGTAVDSFHTVAEDFSAVVASPLASLISNILAYVAVFFVSLLLLMLLFLLLDKFIDSVRPLNNINHFLGAILGILTAFFALAILTWLLGVLISLFGKSETLHLLAENSRLFGFFQNLNFFNLFTDMRKL